MGCCCSKSHADQSHRPGDSHFHKTMQSTSSVLSSAPVPVLVPARPRVHPTPQSHPTRAQHSHTSFSADYIFLTQFNYATQPSRQQSPPRRYIVLSTEEARAVVACGGCLPWGFPPPKKSSADITYSANVAEAVVRCGGRLPPGVSHPKVTRFDDTKNRHRTLTPYLGSWDKCDQSYKDRRKGAEKGRCCGSAGTGTEEDMLTRGEEKEVEQSEQPF